MGRVKLIFLYEFYRGKIRKHLHNYTLSNSFYREKQRNLQKIREKLAAQLQQKVSDEDERIRKAVEEAEEKRAKEEAEKEAKMLKGMEESAKHRNKQVSPSSWQPQYVPDPGIF